MTYIEKKREEYERFLDTLPALKDGENKDPITDWWLEQIQQAKAEERVRVRGEIEKQFGDFLLKNWSGEEEVYSEIDRLKTDLLASLDKLTDNK